MGTELVNKETGEISFVKFNFCPACGRKIY